MLRPLALLGCTLAPLTAQGQAFPKPGSDPAGVVVDERGNGLAGCRVELVALHEPGDPYARATLALLAAAPLPRALTQEGGRFVLHLTREQRLLGGGGEGRFALRVAKDGYQTWLEPMPSGLGLWLGSRVVLAKLRAEDRLVLRVTNPRPGLRLGLRRTSELGAEPWSWLEVPGDGRLAVPFPAAPLPSLASGVPGPIFVEACLESAGVTLASRHLENVIEPLELACPAVAEAQAPRAAVPQTPEAAARGSLELRVRDAEGQEVAGAAVLLDDAALDRPGRAVPVTDEQGIVRLLDLPARGITFLVLAEGFLVGSGSFVVGPGARGQAGIVLRTRVLHDLRTCRIGGGVAAGVPLHVTVREPGEKRGTTSLLVTDSLGRLRIPSARDCAVTARIAGELLGREAMEVDGLTEIETEDSRLAVLRLGPGEYVTAIERVREGRHDWEFKGAGARNPTAWCVGELRRDEDAATFFLADAPPLRVFGSELRGDGKGACPALVVDRPRVARRIALDVTGPGGAKVTPLRITPGPSSDYFDWRRGTMLEVDAGGSCAFVARDAREYECTAWHPDYLPFPLTIPAQRADARDGPLAIRLERGSPLTIRVAITGEPPPVGTECTYLLAPEARDRVLYVNDRIRAESITGQTLTLRSPAALPPGALELRVSIAGYEIAKQPVTVEDGKPCVVELTATPRR